MGKLTEVTWWRILSKAEELRPHSIARVNNLNVLRGLEEEEGVGRKWASKVQSAQ